MNQVIPYFKVLQILFWHT